MACFLCFSSKLLQLLLFVGSRLGKLLTTLFRYFRRLAVARVPHPDGHGVPEAAGDADRLVGGRQLRPGAQLPGEGRMRRDLGEDMLGKNDANFPHFNLRVMHSYRSAYT